MGSQVDFPFFGLPFLLRVIAPLSREAIVLHLEAKEAGRFLRLCSRPALIKINGLDSLEAGHVFDLWHVEDGDVLDGLWVLQRK